MRTFKFEKLTDECWYVILPEWTGQHADLQMVAGADTLLDIIAEGQNIANLTISLEPFEGSNFLIKIEDTPHIGGANYIMKSFREIEFNLHIWLCDVLTWIYGYNPDILYFV